MSQDERPESQNLPAGEEPAAEEQLPQAQDATPPEQSEQSEQPDAESAASDGEGGEMGLLEHLTELRRRLVRCVIAVLVGFLACYSFAEQMFGYLMDPMREVFRKIGVQDALPPDFFEKLREALGPALEAQGFPYSDKLGVFVDALQSAMFDVVHGGYFQYTYPAEAFFSYLKIALVAGFFLMSPFIFYQLFAFVAPGLYSHERKWMIPIAMISAIFFVSGALFGYFVVFPIAFEFFANFATPEIRFAPKISEYLGFSLKLLFAFGLAFELPLFLLILSRIGLVNVKKLRKFQAYAVVGSFVVSALLTPPDPASQILMAGPLILLYEFGIWLVWLCGKKDKKPEADDEPDGTAEA